MFGQGLLPARISRFLLAVVNAVAHIVYFTFTRGSVPPYAIALPILVYRGSMGPCASGAWGKVVIATTATPVATPLSPAIHKKKMSPL